MTDNAKTLPRILFIVFTTVTELERKGVSDMILQRDENGFFGRVITVHPIAPNTRRIDLDEVHSIYELGWDRFFGAQRMRKLRLLWAPVQFVRAVWVIRKLIIQEKINIVRATDPYFAGLMALLAKLGIGVRVCVSIHADYDKLFELDGPKGAPTVFGLRWPALMIERIVLRGVDLVLPIRESLAHYAVRHGADPQHVRVIPHGIDLAQFVNPPSWDVRKYFGIDAGKIIISFVGRLSNENYVNDVLALAHRLRARRNDFVILMIGGGNEEQRLRAEIRNTPLLAEVVRIEGFHPREVVVAVRTQSDVNLCLMGGFSLIEACASGRPVISYDIEWHSELICDGETGCLVREHDLDGLVSAIETFLGSPELSLRMGSAASRTVFSRHGLDASSVIKVACYRELLGQQ